MHTEMIQALEENVAEFLLEMGRAGGAVERSFDGLQWIIGATPLAYHNAVVRATLDEETCDQEIMAFQAALAAQGCAGSWHLGPSMRPTTLDERLLAQGFVHDGDDVGMGVDLRIPLDAVVRPRHFRIIPVHTAHQLDDFAAVLAQSIGESEARWVQEILARIGLEEESVWQHLVGYVESMPVATATLFFTDETVGFYFNATAPAWRRRGLGSGISAHALEVATEREAQWAVLRASPLGYPVYRRVGFSELANIGLYRWQPGLW
jgi:GNAT superfamily N-acetyltransferase